MILNLCLHILMLAARRSQAHRPPTPTSTWFPPPAMLTMSRWRARRKTMLPGADPWELCTSWPLMFFFCWQLALPETASHFAPENKPSLLIYFIFKKAAGFKCFWNFHPKNWGNGIQFDEHIFQMGWNHQAVFCWQLVISAKKEYQDPVRNLSGFMECQVLNAMKENLLKNFYNF